MKNALLLAALLLTVGCRPPAPGGDVTVECKIPGLGKVTAYVDMDCGQFQTNFDTAKRMLVERGLVPASAVADDGFYWYVDVDVLNRDEWVDPSGDLVTGEYRELPKIILNRVGDALLHEMLHQYQFATFVWDTGSHPHWDTNGYTQADQDYSAVVMKRPLDPLFRHFGS